MKKFNVTATEYLYYDVEIEAENEEEARQKFYDELGFLSPTDGEFVEVVIKQEGEL